MIDNDYFTIRCELDVLFIKDDKWVYYKTISNNFSNITKDEKLKIFEKFLDKQSKTAKENQQYLLVESITHYGDYDCDIQSETVIYKGKLDITDFSSVYEISPCSEKPLILKDTSEIYNTKIEEIA